MLLQEKSIYLEDGRISANTLIYVILNDTFKKHNGSKYQPNVIRIQLSLEQSNL